MIDAIWQPDSPKSVRQCYGVLGYRRQTNLPRKRGHRSEIADEELAAVLRRACEEPPY